VAWSRLKLKVEALFAPSVRDRLAIHMTSYHGSNSETGRAWITVDGQEIPLTDFRHYYAYADRASEIQNQIAPGSPYDRRAWNQAATEYAAKGAYFQWSVHDDLADYLRLSIAAALESAHVLHRALVMVDRRLGKRRFEARPLRPNEHSLVVRLQALRGEAEGWQVPKPGAV
jgi:hypothetical protein